MRCQEGSGGEAPFIQGMCRWDILEGRRLSVQGLSQEAMALEKPMEPYTTEARKGPVIQWAQESKKHLQAAEASEAKPVLGLSPAPGRSPGEGNLRPWRPRQALKAWRSAGWLRCEFTLWLPTVKLRFDNWLK